MDLVPIVVALACALLVGLIVGRWWAVMLALAVGIVAYLILGASTPRVSLTLGVRAVGGWTLATAAGVFTRKVVERGLAARRGET